MTTARAGIDTAARHERAVAQTLIWADEAAAHGDYADALAWLYTLEVTGHERSDAYGAMRRAWRLTPPANRGRSGGGSS